MESRLENGRICSRHFVSGKTADLFNSLNPDWLPTLNLEHSRVKISSTSEDRYQKKRSRVARPRVSDGMNSTVEAPVPDSDRQVVIYGCNVAVQTEESGELAPKLCRELNSAFETIHTLEDTISHITPFTES